MDDLVAHSLAQILQTGLLGCLLILSGFYIWRREKDIAELNKQRVNDWKEIGELLRQNGIVMSQWVTTNTARSDAMDASVEAQRSVSALMQQMFSEQKETRTGIQNLREALIQRGLSL